MKRTLIALAALVPFTLSAGANVLDHKAKLLAGEEVDLATEYKGKVVLVVNVASKSLYTRQFAQMQKIHEFYAEQGLRVVVFPTNDFDNEPNSDAEIANFVGDHDFEFRFMGSISVGGKSQHPLFKELCSSDEFPGKIENDFEKFLISREGKLVNRFDSSVGPGNRKVVDAIRWELADEEGRKKLSPPALVKYMGREIAQTMHWRGAEWLMREMREEEEKTSEMMKNLGLKEGMSVADIGSGNGYHTLKMAKTIGEKGKAYAVDIQPQMLEMLDTRAKKMGIENVVKIHNEFWDAKLPENSIDLALMVDVYHEFSHPAEMLASIRKALKPGGRIVLVEFRLEDPKVPIKLLHKMSKEQIMKEYTANDFKLVESYDELPWQHMMFFGKDEPNGK